MIQAFQLYTQPFNLYTDSHYIFRLFPAIETAIINHDKTSTNDLLLQLQELVQTRLALYFIGHLWAHTQLPGPLVESNCAADLLTHLVVSDPVSEAWASYALHHQNSQALRYQFNLTREAACQIVKNCPYCPVTFLCHKWV